jgi:hypothetical protein
MPGPAIRRRARRIYRFAIGGRAARRVAYLGLQLADSDFIPADRIRLSWPGV